MTNEDAINTERALEKVKKISRGIRVFLLALAVLMGALLLVKAGAAIGSAGGFAASIVPMAVSDAIVIACIAIGAKVFSDLGRGVDPFSEKQSKRLRAAALLLVLDLAVTAAGSVGAPWLASYDLLTVGMNTGPAAETIVNVNAGDLVVAGILFGLSVVFDYARLLQELSDETL